MQTTFDINQAAVYDDRKEALQAARQHEANMKSQYRVFRDANYRPIPSPDVTGFIVEVQVDAVDDLYFEGWLCE